MIHIIICRGIYRYAQLKIAWNWTRIRDANISEIFDQTTKSFPDKISWYFEDTAWTFSRVSFTKLFTENFFTLPEQFLIASAVSVLIKDNTKRTHIEA